MSAQRVMFVGNPRHHEFREVVTWLNEYCAYCHARCVHEALYRLSTDESPPDALILAQSHPEALRQATWDLLRRHAPHARRFVLLGGWCQGESRGVALPEDVRAAYGHQFLPRFGRLLIQNHGIGVEQPARHREFVAIRSRSLDAYECIASCCLAAGYSTAWIGESQTTFVSNAAAAVWDSDQAMASDTRGLREFVSRLDGIPVIVLAGFPRGDDLRASREAGAAAVVSKPFLHSELQSELARIQRSVRSVSPWMTRGLADQSEPQTSPGSTVTPASIVGANLSSCARSPY